MADLFTDIADAIREKDGSSDDIVADNFPDKIRAVTGMDDTLASFTRQRSEVTDYLSAANAYTNSNYSTTSVIANHVADGVVNDGSLGYDLTVKESGTIHFCDETDNRFSWKGAVSAGTYTVYNLIPEHIYRWYVINALGQTAQNGKLKATGQVRMINAPAVNTTGEGTNIRDLGGWSGNGGKVKYGVLYRGAIPYIISSDMKDKMKNVFSIKAQVDLYAEQLSQAHKLWSDILYTRLPLSNAGGTANVTLGTDYCKLISQALTAVMDNASKGVATYFHCWAGSDRTGTLAWLLLQLLGVSEADCDKDYELTGFSGRLDRYRNVAGNWVAFVNYMNSFGKSTLLDNVLYWCARNGITAKLINSFRKAMIEGTPSTITFNNTVTNTLTNMTNGNSASQVTNGAAYSVVLSLTDGATFEKIKITMNGEDITDKAWSESTLTVSIPEVTGDIVITAEASINAVSVTYNLTNVTALPNTSSAMLGESFMIMLSVAEGYSVGNVTVKMGGVDITNTTYDAETKTVYIASVTGAITITAEKTGYKNQLPYAIDTDGNIYNGTGYKSGYRLNSSGNEVVQSGMCCTGFIPYTNGQQIQLKNITVNGISSAYFNVYDSSFNFLKSVSSFNNYLTLNNGIYESAIPGTHSNAAYMRLSVGVIDDTSIITVNEDITD